MLRKKLNQIQPIDTWGNDVWEIKTMPCKSTQMSGVLAQLEKESLNHGLKNEIMENLRFATE